MCKNIKKTITFKALKIKPLNTYPQIKPKQKVGFHTSVRRITQPNNRNITQLVGFHKRYGQTK